LENNFGTNAELVQIYNNETGSSITFGSYHKSPETRLKLSVAIIDRGVSWITNGSITKQMDRREIGKYLVDNTDYKLGRTYD
jgi:hypothetical protein